ncbi:hypothetical protein LSCM1_05705 [Leishmania martiniquensis]|uniref:LysM domain-containing protein n=1 Tax=Leishmania martiniquensis TaxID=1580590 RepID=A0A836GH70_9TRYP|nr:hypothetical protein LSCM1_05705 [Leishmania martiniquensis]
MEGLRRQVELLHAALQPLGVCRSGHRHEQPPTLPDEVASELQLALSRATALAHWAAAVQREQTLQPLPRSDGGAEGLQWCAPTQQQTLRSVAAALRVSVADILHWNPQLPPTLHEEDVLPPDTFLKVRPAPSSGSPLRPSAASASRTRPAVSATGPLEVAVSDSASVARSTSARTQGSDAGTGERVAYRRHNSSAACRQNSSANRAAGAGGSSGGVGSGVLPHSSEGGASQGRYSAWTVVSGRGASQSPRVQELSMSNSGADAAPPSCAPAPLLMSMSVSLPSAPDGCDLIDLREDVSKLSPSPKSDGTSSSKARRRRATAQALSPSPPAPSLAPSHLRGAATSPSAAVAGLDATPSHDCFHRRDSVGSGDCAASARAIYARGHFRFPSSSLAGEVLGAPAVTPKSPSSISGTIATSGASNALSQSRLQSCTTDGDGDRRGEGHRTAGVATAASAVQRQQAKDRARALPLPSPTRQSSVSLSALSPPSSLGDEGWSSTANGRTRAGEEKEGGEGGGTDVQRLRRRSSSQQRQQASTLSPSLAAPSDSSAGSPVTKAQLPASAATVCRAAVASCNIDSPSRFRTPIQHRDCPGPQRTTGATRSHTSCSDADHSPLSSPLSSSESRSGAQPEAAESPLSDADGFMEDEEEDTPSMRPPAMLGRNACSPPPNLSRLRPRGSFGACRSTSPLSRVVEPPPQYLRKRGDVASALDEAEMADGDDYDTLEGIAAAYNLTVLTIIEWNPYLKTYRPSEPLPPDLPIVLPMSDADEEGDEETSSSAGELYAQEREQRQLVEPQFRLGNRTPGAYSPSVASDDSPMPLPPL